MPKLGAKADDRPYYYRCRDCGCEGLNRLIVSFKPNGEAARRIWACDRWHRPGHDCDDLHREGCDAERVYTDGPVHMHDDHNNGMTSCPGDAADCVRPDDRAGKILVNQASRECIEQYKDVTAEKYLANMREEQAAENSLDDPDRNKFCILCASGQHPRSTHEVGVGEPPEAGPAPFPGDSSPWKPRLTSADVDRVLGPFVLPSKRGEALEAMLTLLHGKGIDCDPPF